MTPLDIREDAPEVARGLLEASHALMHELFEPDSNHMLSLEGLKGDDIRFFVARLGDAVVGCGAVAQRVGYAEVKSMFVSEAARGAGVGLALMARIEEAAADGGNRLLRLETGDLLHAARRLYTRCGFVERGPFGDYQACGGASVFMEKEIG